MYVRSLGLLVAIAAALMAFVATASATSVSSTTGGAAATPTIHAVNEGGHVTLANPIANIECQATTESKVESHGTGVAARGNVSTFTLTGCTNGWHITAIKLGSLEIRWGSGYVGVYWSTGLNISGTRFGVTCNYETNNTSIGTFTGGNPATIHLEGSIPLAAGSSFLCGSGNAKLEGAYVTTSALYVKS